MDHTIGDSLGDVLAMARTGRLAEQTEVAQEESQEARLVDSRLPALCRCGFCTGSVYLGIKMQLWVLVRPFSAGVSGNGPPLGCRKSKSPIARDHLVGKSKLPVSLRDMGPTAKRATDHTAVIQVVSFLAGPTGFTLDIALKLWRTSSKILGGDKKHMQRISKKGFQITLPPIVEPDDRGLEDERCPFVEAPYSYPLH